MGIEVCMQRIMSIHVLLVLLGTNVHCRMGYTSGSSFCLNKPFQPAHLLQADRRRKCDMLTSQCVTPARQVWQPEPMEQLYNSLSQ